MPDMNVRHGLLRLWIVASLLWLVAFVVWYFWTQCGYSVPGKTDMCWTGEGDWVGDIRYFSIGTYARLFAIALSVPIGVLFVGYLLAWVLRGFRQSN
jgi:hypothetical protein